MSTPSRFKAETKYGKSQERKANRNLPMMARVGNGDDANETVATGRNNFYWIRLVNDDNRLTQCYSLIPLSYDDLIYVRRARDRDLSYYEFDKFIQDGDENTAPPTQIHDHSEDIQGGDALNPATVTPQTFIVGPDPAPYNTLEEAADAVNAFGPTAANPCTIHIQGIVTVETGHITLDDYCNISGEGMSDYESVIGLGEFQLNMATHTSISDVCIKSTSGNAVVWPDLSTGYMHNVHILAAGTTGFLTQGTVAVRAHRVLIRDSGALASGFRIDNGVGYVMLDFCEVDSSGGITDGLDVDQNYVISRFCRFSCPGGDDVDVAAGATWYDVASQYDVDNITVAGTYTPLPQSAVNLDGRADALILDADGDTTISAPTDDQIDVEIAGTDYGTYTERVHAWDEVYDVGTWYDHQVEDATDGDHFRENGATFPTGWTESDAAVTTDTSTRFSFWYLRGTNADVSWKYRRQMNATITAGTWCSFIWGPILWRDGDFTADVDYYFGLYSDDGLGAIDEDIYIRVHLWWDSANSLWKIRGEEGDGSAGNEFANPDHTGAWQTFGFPLHQPIWVRSLVRNVAAQTCRAYVGTAPWPRTHTLLLDQNPTAANWDVNNGLWLQAHQTRGAGAEDYLFIGAVDYQAAV